MFSTCCTVIKQGAYKIKQGAWISSERAMNKIKIKKA